MTCIYTRPAMLSVYSYKQYFSWKLQNKDRNVTQCMGKQICEQMISHFFSSAEFLGSDTNLYFVSYTSHSVTQCLSYCRNNMTQFESTLRMIHPEQECTMILRKFCSYLLVLSGVTSQKVHQHRCENQKLCNAPCPSQLLVRGN